MMRMVDDLLRMGRALRKAVEPGSVDLTAVCHEIGRRLGAANPGRRAEWLFSPGMEVNADLGLVCIAMENLLDNAWKYTSRQELARIEVQCSCTQSEFLVSVRDNGVGFDMSDAPKLFAPFSRLKSAIDFEGTGVGLATVQRIVHRHGGRIWAESAPGQGATFHFTLSRVTAEPKGSEPPPT